MSTGGGWDSTGDFSGLNLGSSLYCGDNCNHVGPHRYPPQDLSPFPETFAAAYCPHGLDMRIYARCYLCAPLDGCLCPGFWWGIIPPPCPVHNPTVPTVTTDHT